MSLPPVTNVIVIIISSTAARADWFPIDGWSGGRLVRAGSPALVPGTSTSYPALLGSLPEGPIGQPESNSGFINGKVFLHMVSFQRISIWHLHMHLLQFVLYFSEGFWRVQIIKKQ